MENIWIVIKMMGKSRKHQTDTGRPVAVFTDFLAAQNYATARELRENGKLYQEDRGKFYQIDRLLKNYEY